MTIANYRIQHPDQLSKTKPVASLWRSLQIACLSLLICLPISLSIFAFSAPAWATVQIRLSDLTYIPCEGDIGKNMVIGGGVMSANCYVIKGMANNVSGKPVYNADIFGRIYDANGNDAMPERTRLGSVDELPPGKSEFQLIVAIPADQPEPLDLKQFKASGFAGKVRR